MAIFKRRIQDTTNGPTTYVAASTTIVGTIAGKGAYVFCGTIEGDCDIDGPLTLAAGDSFTFGDEVNDDESWPAALEQLTGRRVINAGVPGFGLDQAVLRAEQLMGYHHKSRVLCTEADGRLVGVISLSDIAQREDDRNTAQTVRRVTEQREAAHGARA